VDTFPIGLIELAVVFGFALAWAILELYCLRLDKKRQQEKDSAERERPST